MTNERITAAGKVFVVPRTSEDYGQVELLTNLEDGAAYIRVVGGGALGNSAIGQIADKNAMRRMGLALLALSEFELGKEIP